MAKIKITANLVTGGGKLFIDNLDLSKYCKGLLVNIYPGQPPEVKVDLVGDIEIEGEADIIMKLPNGKVYKVERK